MRSLGLALLILGPLSPVVADGPGDNDPAKVRKVPPDGIALEPSLAKELSDGARQLAEGIADVRNSGSPRAKQLLPDVQIFEKAVRWAVEYREFFRPGDVNAARALLKAGETRLAELRAGRAPWTTATGLVVRGFRSKIDGSVQPYGLVVPESYVADDRHGFRCDVWLHGRGERTCELQFLVQRMKQVGRYAPPHTLVLHPYGRYSNAFKFAGEIDVFEALDHVRANYTVDDDRVSIRGFSMGGAGCWQLAVHYPDVWFANNPGAGFSETPEFLRTFQNETLRPEPWEKTLWQWYDCPVYAANLAQLPTVAYSGEVDRQKQAADVMEAALAKEGIDLVHLIGPKTGHTIHRDSMREIESKLAALAETGRNRVPHAVHFATPTLRYNRSHWLTVDGLEEHWKPARVDARLHRRNRIELKTSGTRGLSFDLRPGDAPFELTQPVRIQIDDQVVSAPPPRSDRSWRVSLHRAGESWKLGEAKIDGLRKRHGLQGPVDDAFMDAFVFVRPTGESRHETVARWVESELDHAVVHWRQQFRGDAVVKNDTAVSEADIANANLVLWGDTSSNAVLASIAKDLPIAWGEKTITVGDRTFDATHHAPILIFPNPLNPDRYVVLNSSFTYREYAYLNNARQVPMLPDWAIVDLRTPPGTRWPGKITAADFFDERWRVK